jgi:hypothetical protein
MKIPSKCDLQLPDGGYRGREPVRFIGLSADRPDSGVDIDACLSGFCCRQHADARPRPTLARRSDSAA